MKIDSRTQVVPVPRKEQYTEWRGHCAELEADLSTEEGYRPVVVSYYTHMLATGVLLDTCSHCVQLFYV